VITPETETNQQTTYIIDSNTDTITEVTKTEDTLVEVPQDQIEVIATNTTVVTPILDKQDNVESICVTSGGDTACSDVKDTVIEPTPIADIVIDVTVPTSDDDTVVKVIESDNKDI